ncbi:MAG: DUF5916 domain-containing protein [Acidobacteriota bacterium]|nr:DUF5916 domain-containing protein [Acidobacteriota bacterium]
MRSIGAAVFVCLFLRAPLFGQAINSVSSETMVREPDGRATVRTIRLPSPMQFDGRLDESFYRDTKPFGDFIQQEPHDGQPATEKTEAWVFFDDNNVYVAVRLWETDSKQRVMSDMRRDSFNLYNNDHIAVIFDTFNDHRNGFGFSSNAQGGIFDWQITNEQPSPNWNGLWESRTAEFDGGWSVEFRIPFRSIRFQEGGDTWGINFRRMVRWKNEVSYLSPVPLSWGRRGLYKLSSAGALVGVEVPKKLRNIDIKPYALGSTTTNTRSIPALDNDGNAEFGVDAKWGITQTFVTDFTYNTDFAQVEDDEAQVNLTRFSVLFPEKRDFFLEGQDVFNFGGSGANQGGGGIGPQAIQGGGGGGGGNNVTPIVFFSRRIGLQNGVVVPILGGARLIGRGGGYQVGALHMRSDDNAAALAAATDFSVIRINRDVLSRSRVGVIATRRGPRLNGSGENYAYGVDTQINPRTELQLNGYWAATADAAGAAASAQQSYRGQFNWNADKTGLQLDHLFVGKDFNPEIGFLRRAAFRRTYGSTRYSPRPAWQGVRKIYYEASLDYLEDPGGRPESREAQGAFRMEMNSSDQVAFEYSRQFESLSAIFAVTPGVNVPPGAYDFSQGKFLFTTAATRPVSGTMILTRGGFYGGTLSEWSWRGRVELGSRFQVEPTVSLNHFKTLWGDGDSNIISSRFTYTLTPRMFASALVQYQSAADAVSTNARFRWEYQPGSELFVVYSDGRNTIGPGVPVLDNRSLVVKLTKLFRF